MSTQTACTALDDFFMAKAAGQPADPAFAQLLPAMGFNPDAEISRCRQVLSLMDKARQIPSLSKQLIDLQTSPQYQEACDAPIAIATAIQQLESQLIEQTAKLGTLKLPHEIAAQKAVLENLRDILPQQLATLRAQKADADRVLAVANARHEALEDQIDDCSAAFEKLSSREYLPLHVRKQQSTPSEEYTTLNNERRRIDGLLAKANAVKFGLDRAKQFTSSESPPTDTIDAYCQLSGLTIRSNQLWIYPQQFHPAYVPQNENLWDALTMHLATAIPLLQSEHQQALAELQALTTVSDESVKYYLDRI